MEIRSLTRNELNSVLDLLQLIHDEKPTVVRQSLNALKEVVEFRPELCELRELIEEKQEI